MSRADLPWHAGREHRSMGRSSLEVDCPFCGAALVVYLWSLAGCGKKLCGCGAAICRDGIARKEIS